MTSLPGNSKKHKLGLYLTKLAHISAPFVTSFLLIHLSAPALSNVGGSSLSSQTMLLGREYYQTDFGEKYLVLGPLAVHALAGIVKRVFLPKEMPLRPISSLLSVTGYATALLFLPIHFMTHRVNPTADTIPILAVGPSELDYEFVKLGLQKWPIRSWVLYSGLVIAVTLHAVDGMAIIWNTWLKDKIGASWKQSTRKRRLALMVGVVTLPVIAGLFSLAKEPLMLFASTADRYKASYLSSIIYRL